MFIKHILYIFRMPEYVPYYTIVRQPGRQFLREFGSDGVMGNRDMDSGEFGREAQTKWPSYQDCVNRSLSFNFYHRAPTTPHWVITLAGERKYLKDTTEIKEYYISLPPIEKRRILENGGALSDLIEKIELTQN
jgi:hypothetical protein